MNTDHVWRYTLLGTFFSILAAAIIGQMIRIQLDPEQVAHFKEIARSLPGRMAHCVSGARRYPGPLGACSGRECHGLPGGC